MRKSKRGKIILDTEELDYIKNNWAYKTAQEIAAHLGISKNRARAFAYEMGCKKMEMEYWTVEQVEFLRNNYKKIGDLELAEIFNAKWHKDKGWTNKHIEKKRGYLKLKRTNAEKKEIHQGHVKKGAFIKGSVKTWNTRGVMLPGEVRIWKHVTGARFKVIKTADGFVHYNRWLWEKHHGSIPEGMMVRTKNDNPLDIRIENLELLYRSEHALKNTLLRYPEPLREVVKTHRKLKEQLKENTNGQ